MEAAEIADAAGLHYEPPMAGATFKKEGDTYITGFPNVGVVVEVSRVEPSKSEMHGVIRVTSTSPGIPPELHQARFNLTSTSARTALVRYLEKRDPQTDWAEVIEQVCLRVLDAVREGEPVIRITTAAAAPERMYRVGPLIVDGFPNIIFGPGGSGKSQLAAMLAMAVHGEDGKGWSLCDLDVKPGPVLVCDWELDDVTYRSMCDPIARGFEINLPDFHYRRCVAPLAEESASIGRYIEREGIQMVVVDSLGYAIGGDKASQELTMKMFAAIRGWGRTTLCVDHITNDEAQGNRPYGSVYTVNSARSLWRVRAHQEDGSNELSVGLFQTKANFGKQPPVGFLFRFSDGATSIERQDVRDVAAFQDNLSLSMRIKTALLDAREALTVADLGERLGMTTKPELAIIATRCSQMKRSGYLEKIVVHGVGASAKYCLPTDREP